MATGRGVLLASLLLLLLQLGLGWSPDAQGAPVVEGEFLPGQTAKAGRNWTPLLGKSPGKPVTSDSFLLGPCLCQHLFPPQAPAIPMPACAEPLAARASCGA